MHPRIGVVTFTNGFVALDSGALFRIELQPFTVKAIDARGYQVIRDAARDSAVESCTSYAEEIVEGQCDKNSARDDSSGEPFAS